MAFASLSPPVQQRWDHDIDGIRSQRPFELVAPDEAFADTERTVRTLGEALVRLEIPLPNGVFDPDRVIFGDRVDDPFAGRQRPQTVEFDGDIHLGSDGATDRLDISRIASQNLIRDWTVDHIGLHLRLWERLS